MEQVHQGIANPREVAMENEWILRVITCIVMAGVGLYFSQRVRLNQNFWIWFGCLTLLILSAHIGVSTRLISIQGYSMYFNNVLEGLLFGLLIGQVRYGTRSNSRHWSRG
jgi:hypothetical protein